MWENFERNFLKVKLVVSLLIAGAVAVGGLRGWLSLLPLVSGNRSAIYTSLTAVLGTILGFVITGVSVILALTESTKLRALKTSPHYGTLFNVYISAAKFLAVGTIVALVGVLFIPYAMLWLVLISAFRLFRCIRILERLMAIVTAVPEDVG